MRLREITASNEVLLKLSETKTDFTETYNELSNILLAARHLTNVYYKEFTDKIDPTRLRSREWVIDHIFSIYDGYMNSVPLEVIYHWTNLQIIHKTKNSSKNCRSDKTLDELYEDYRLAQTEPVSSTPLPCSK